MSANRIRDSRKKSNSRFVLALLLLASTFIILGCGNFLIGDVLDGKSSTPLSLTPSVVSLLVNGQQAFQVAGGVPPYSYSIASGGGAMAGATYHAPASATTAIVRATDTAGKTRDATVTVSTYGNIGITPQSITIRVDDTVEFSALGGDPPYTYTIEDGGGSFTSFTGLNGEYGEYTAPLIPDTVTVRVTDSASNFAEAAVTVEAGVVLGISPSDIALEVDDTLQFSGYGGSGGYTFSITAGPGDITADGLFTATEAGSVAVRVEDGVSDTAMAAVAVSPSLLTLSPSSITIQAGGTASFEASGGTEPYGYTVTPPAVGTIDFDNGLFTAVGTGTATVTVTDADSTTATAAATVSDAPPAVLSLSPTEITVEVGSTVSFSANGGTLPYSYDVPATVGTIDGSGVFTAGAPGIETVTVTDGDSNTATAAVTVNARPLILSPVSITIELGDSVTFSADDGTTPYTYSQIPDMGDIGSATGVFTAGNVGAFTIQVTDDDATTATATVNVTDPIPQVNYEITTPGGYPAGGLTNEPFGGDFTITNNGGDNGILTGTWYVYLSTDPAVNVGDEIVESGPFGPLDAGISLPGVPYSGTWPDAYGQYYLIIDLVVADDTVGPNTADSGVLNILMGKTGTAHETEPNGSWNPVAVPQDIGFDSRAEADDFGIVLQPGTIITIRGNMETDGADIYTFNAGSAGSIVISSVWEDFDTPGDADDAMDLVLFDDAGSVIDGPWTGSGWEQVTLLDVVGPPSPDYTGADLYVTVGNFRDPPPDDWNANEGKDRPYTLIIQGISQP